MAPDRPISAEDLRWCLALGWLNVTGQVPGSWVDGAIEAVRRRTAGPPNNLFRYLKTCLWDVAGEGDKERGKQIIDDMLAAVDVPPELVNPPQDRPAGSNGHDGRGEAGT